MLSIFQKKIPPSQTSLQADTSLEPISGFDLAAFLSYLVAGQYEQAQANAHNAPEATHRFAEELKAGEVESLKRSVDLSISINKTVIAGAEMSKSAKDINERSNGMAAAVQELTASVQEIAGRMNDVAEETTRMDGMARAGIDLSSQATARMNDIHRAVTDTANKVENLAAATHQIAGVVKFITEIAEQTNLLALNATIEAARAGDAGKGFAVVAGEVKSLANKTNEHAKDIVEKIKVLQTETGIMRTLMQTVTQTVTQGQAAIEKTHAEIEQISHSAAAIMDQAHSVTNVLQEQRQATNEIAQGVGIVADMTRVNVDKINATLDITDVAEKIILSQIQSFVGREIPNLTVHLAKSDHVVWMKRLANMLVGRDTLKPEELASHKGCRLGKWYYALTDSRYKNHSAYKQLEAPHEAVHAHGIEAARKYQARDLAGAIEEVRLAGEASKEVLRLLDELLKA